MKKMSLLEKMMSDLYTIVKALQNASGSNSKQAILESHKDNEVLKAYLKACYDPAISYYISKAPKVDSVGQNNLDKGALEGIQYHLADRNITGKQAQKWLHYLMEAATEESQELIELLIKRSIGAGVGDTMILKAFPDLYFIPPYQRCSLMDAKIAAKFEDMPTFLCQTKCDGSFAFLYNGHTEGSKTITRAGSTYPSWLTDKLVKGVPKGCVLIGELEVLDSNGLLNRQMGNGVLNSILKGADEQEFDAYRFQITVWDWLTEVEFKAGKSVRKYGNRFLSLQAALQNAPIHLKLVDSWEVGSLAEAYKIYSEHTAKGLEGCVIKSPDSCWKNGTAKDIVKLKIKADFDLRVTGIYEGTGKYVGMMGGLSIATSDNLLQCDLGTGFSEEQRKVFWMHKHDLLGKIVTVSANDVIASKGSDIKSLFLPAFEMVRHDKAVADSLEQVMEQLQAAKGGV